MSNVFFVCFNESRSKYRNRFISGNIDALVIMTRMYCNGVSHVFMNFLFLFKRYRRPHQVNCGCTLIQQLFAPSLKNSGGIDSVLLEPDQEQGS